MQHRHLKNMLTEHSLLASREFKIDKNNLKIIKLSSSQGRKDTIPLCLITATPETSNHPDIFLLAFALISAVACGVFFWASQATNELSLQLMAIALFTSCLIGITAAIKHKSTKYTFYYANTTTRLFTLRDTQSNNTPVKTFVDQLSQQISHSQKVFSQKTDEVSQFNKHLEYLYNFGVLDDVLYKRIEKNIHEKLHGIDTNKPLADVIFLPLKKA